jgi:hypothetical protein
VSGAASSAVLFFLVTATLPYLFFGGGLRARFARLDASLLVLGALLFVIAPAAGIVREPELMLAIAVVARLALFGAFLAANAGSDEVVWSAAKAGVFACAVYLSLIPRVLVDVLDGDEPYYVLVADSLLHDHDLDLRNQYAASVRIAGRELGAQPGDPVGSHGEAYSRHEPFLPILLLPGYAAGGVPGAVATIAFFGGLLVWSLLLMIEGSVGSRAARIVFPLIAFGPPLLFYATRIWPEVPAAFFLSEALRRGALRAPTPALGTGAPSAPTPSSDGWRFASIVSIVALALLKLRFGLIAVPLLAIAALDRAADMRRRVVYLIAALIPFVLLLLFARGTFSARAFDLAAVASLPNFARGAFGTMLDAQAGLLFQAPLFFVALLALLSMRELPSPLKTGLVAAIPYLLLLFPRSEWHGGWAPPLRYLVVFLPIFALAAALLVDRISTAALAAIAVATALLALHGVAFPPRLFHIENGESATGESLSRMYAADFSRLLPSFIRMNEAARIASVVLLAIAALVIASRFVRIPIRFGRVAIAVATLLLAAGFAAGLQPGSRVDFEDAHVEHTGGELYPPLWTVARFAYRGGWLLQPDVRLSFLYRGGRSVLTYRSDSGCALSIGGVAVELPLSSRFTAITVALPERAERWEIVCRRGTAIVDRIEHE